MIISLTEDVRGDGGEGRQSLNDMTHADSVLEMLEEDKTMWAKWEELANKTLVPIYERERHPLGGSSSATGGDDAYMTVGGMSTIESMLNDKFAQMLESSAFAPPPDTDFDIKGSNDTPMMPEIMHDSSSSSDEEDLAERHRAAEDDADFNPRGDATSGDKSSSGGDAWANFEAAANSWANFEQAASAFDPNDASFAAFPVTLDSPPAVMEFVNDSDAPSFDSSELESEAPAAETPAAE
ncbi:hypothetical protein PINS_up007877 [Pythium insidiosum]|nr:hypothetical protein PINS_up007877 [Pythium insidiosum]